MNNKKTFAQTLEKVASGFMAIEDKRKDNFSGLVDSDLSFRETIFLSEDFDGFVAEARAIVEEKKELVDLGNYEDIKGDSLARGMALRAKMEEYFAKAKGVRPEIRPESVAPFFLSMVDDEDVLGRMMEMSAGSYVAEYTKDDDKNNELWAHLDDMVRIDFRVVDELCRSIELFTMSSGTVKEDKLVESIKKAVSDAELILEKIGRGEGIIRIPRELSSGLMAKISGTDMSASSVSLETELLIKDLFYAYCEKDSIPLDVETDIIRQLKDVDYDGDSPREIMKRVALGLNLVEPEINVILDDALKGNRKVSR